jgi:magnesium transporter
VAPSIPRRDPSRHLAAKRRCSTTTSEDFRTDPAPVATAPTLAEEWPALDREQRSAAFEGLPRVDAQEFFTSLRPADCATLILDMPQRERRLWIRLLAPDDAADMVQSVEGEERGALLDLLDARTRDEVAALMAYAEDDAGGRVSPRYARVRPEMTVGQAISYLRRQAPQLETIYYAYVLDAEQHLLGVVSFRELVGAPESRLVRDAMLEDVVTVPEEMDQEAVAALLAERNLLAVPVVDREHRLKGIITVDDIMDVVREEATEDIQKIGGVETLDMPYLQVSTSRMVRKRVGWLTALFISEMLTATAMGVFQDEIAQAVVLALFVPLIISSGGNSGSQASTLIVRAMALSEVRMRDWLRIFRRELVVGLSLGIVLAVVGMMRIMSWQFLFHAYGAHATRVALTVAVSLVGVVTWGTLAGSMLPFAMRRLGFDPASASAPFVATMSDVTGLVIYFTVARVLLLGHV